MPKTKKRTALETSRILHAGRFRHFLSLWKLKQIEVARALKVSASFICDIAHARKRITPPVAMALELLYGVNADWLLGSLHAPSGSERPKMYGTAIPVKVYEMLYAARESLDYIETVIRQQQWHVGKLPSANTAPSETTLACMRKGHIPRAGPDGQYIKK